MMKRTIRALIPVLAMLIALLGAPKAASAASTTITVSADKTEAGPGDTINMSVTLGPVSEMGTMQMVIVIPNGLTYVQGSGALAPDLRTTLGFDMADFTEVSMMVNGVASKADYSSDGDTLLCTFRCTVNAGFSGRAEVSLTELEFYSCQNWQDHTGDYSVKTAVITVAGGETEEETEAPTTAEETAEAPTETPTQPDETVPESEAETTEADETTEAAETTEASETETSKEEPGPAPSTEGPAETTNDQPAPAESTESGDSETSEDSQSSEASQSGEDATEEASTEESTKEEEGSTAPENTDQTVSKEAAVTTEEQGSKEEGSTDSKDADKSTADGSGTKPGESDKDKKDPDSDKSSTRDNNWIWLAAAVLAISAGVFLLIFFARRGRAEEPSERGRSRKRAK